jgi:hypothetical protein
MNRKYIAAVLTMSLGLLACGTPISQFGVYKQSDGTIGVHSPKSATQEEAQVAAVEECKKLGKRTATILESRQTVNDRFPMTYLYRCGG